MLKQHNVDWRILQKRKKKLICSAKHVCVFNPGLVVLGFHEQQCSNVFSQ